MDDRVLQFLVLDAKNQVAEALSNDVLDRSDLGLGSLVVFSPGQDTQRNCGVGNRYANLGNMAPARQVIEFFLDVRLAGAETVDFPLHEHAAANAESAHAGFALG